MRDPRIEPLDPSLEALIEAERSADLRPDLPEVQARVGEAVRARLDGVGDDGPGGSGGGGSPTGLGGAGLALLVGLGLGLPAGWALHAARAPQVALAPVPSEPSAPIDVPEAAPIEAPVPPPLPIPAAAAAPPAPPVPSPPAVESEQARIDQARVALRRDRPHDALVALMGHAREHPDGRLAEERERLMIEALLAQGRTNAGNERFTAFEARWPESIHLAALRALFEPAAQR